MWEQIRANQRRSAVLILSMTLVLVLLGACAGYAFDRLPGSVFGIGIALIILGIQLAIYFSSAESVLLSGANAQEIKREDSPQLFNVVEEMKLAAGLPFMPLIHLIDDPSPNAFAIGNKPENSAICVTTGLLHRLNRDELQGVIGHEIGHLKNRDVQFMTLAAVMLGSIVILSEVTLRSMQFGGRSRNRDQERGGNGQLQMILAIVALVFAILGPLMAQLLYFACSRKREYLADASSVQFTRYPEGLAAALEKISQAQVPVSFANRAIAPMFIINPLAAAGDAGGLFATHPATADRIRILRGMKGASLSAYEEAFKQTNGNSLIGNESLQSDQVAAIRAAADEGPIETRRDVRNLTYRAHGYLPLHCNCGMEIKVPEGYERDSIRCIRCGSTLAVPSAVPPPLTPPASIPSQPIGAFSVIAPALTYTRKRSGWESFRCACGATLQLSPAFVGTNLQCKSCGRQIQVNG